MPPQNVEVHPPSRSEPLEAWIWTILDLAAAHGSGLPLAELGALLPPGSPMDEAELRDWIAAHPDIATVEGDWAFQPGHDLRPERDRENRARAYREAALRLLSGPLRSTLPWLRCVGITGSTAYGTPNDDDDVDFLLVARDGRLWLSLMRIYASLLLGTRGGRVAPGPRLCFNYARDDRAAQRQFADPQDLLFAREALTAQIIFGESYYRELLVIAPWMKDHLPVIYARRRGAATGPPLREPRPSLWTRAANGLAYLAIATYLQLAGLRRNATLRRSGRWEAVFRTETTLGGLSFDSIKFERIRARYLAPSRAMASPVSTARGPGEGAGHPTARAPSIPPPGSRASSNGHGEGWSPSTGQPPATPASADGARD